MLDNITLTWLTNTFVSGARLYWEDFENKISFFGVKGVSVPVAVSVFPDELYPGPRSWAEQAYPKLIHYNKVEKGGHFAAWEQPKLLPKSFAWALDRYGNSPVLEKRRLREFRARLITPMEVQMNTTQLVAATMLFVGSGLSPQATPAQETRDLLPPIAGAKRTDLQRHDLSAPEYDRPGPRRY